MLDENTVQINKDDMAMINKKKMSQVYENKVVKRNDTKLLTPNNSQKRRMTAKTMATPQNIKNEKS